MCRVSWPGKCRIPSIPNSPAPRPRPCARDPWAPAGAGRRAVDQAHRLGPGPGASTPQGSGETLQRDGQFFLIFLFIVLLLSPRRAGWTSRGSSARVLDPLASAPGSGRTGPDDLFASPPVSPPLPPPTRPFRPFHHRRPFHIAISPFTAILAFETVFPVLSPFAITRMRRSIFSAFRSRPFGRRFRIPSPPE